MASQIAVEWYGKKCFSSWSIAFPYGIAIIPSESQSESRRITKIDRGKFKRLFPILLKISVIQGISFQEGLIDKDPYDLVSFPRGKCKEHKPLSEIELKKIREAELPAKEERVRDLFIFAAYTGLAYCDVLEFNFKRMVELIGGMS